MVMPNDFKGQKKAIKVATEIRRAYDNGFLAGARAMQKKAAQLPYPSMILDINPESLLEGEGEKDERREARREIPGNKK